MHTPMVCVGDRPDGPFTPVNLDGNGGLLPGSVIGFDPGLCIEEVDGMVRKPLIEFEYPD